LNESSLPLVSIAIPTYNRADSYLPQALKSALSQSYSNLEIIVSDNCSTDNTAGFVSSIGDPRVRYFRHDVNIGPTANVSFCIKQSKGAYLLLLHDDDRIDGDFIETCVQAADGVPDVGIIRTGVRLIDSGTNVLGERPNLSAGLPTSAFFRQWFVANTPVYLCCTLFNGQRIREVGGFSSRHNCYDDNMVIFRLAARYGRLDVPDIKASFRLHGGQGGFGKSIDQWCEDSLELLNLMRDLAAENKDEVFRDGLRFFSRANYRRARMAKSPLERVNASIKVLRHFNFRHLPSPTHFIAIFYGTRLHDVVRHVKRNWRYVGSRA
jgi:glycosyltransferase involved in cell wall biosynthesis